MTSDGNVLYVSPTGQLILAGPGTRQIIASKSTGYFSIGANAGISQDGRVIVFTATRSLGQELWAAFQVNSAWAATSPYR